MKKAYKIIFLIIISVILSGCATLFSKSGKSILNHEIKYSKKGSKSERRSGYLKAESMLIPDCFNTVVDGSRVYIFKSKNTTWGDDGYFPAEDESAEKVYPSVNKNIDDSDLSRGWSEVTGRCLNVPEGWIFVKWNGGSAVVTPGKIDELVKVKDIKLLPRSRMFTEKMLK